MPISCSQTYRHPKKGEMSICTTVYRSLPDPRCVCPTTWASIRVDVAYPVSAVYPFGSGADAPEWEAFFDRRELLWDVFLVGHKLTLRRAGKGGGGFLIRVYQGKGKPEDHARFLKLEKLAHKIAAKSSSMLRREYRRSLSRRGLNANGLP